MKKLFALVFSILLLVTLMAGCSDKSSGDGKDSDTTTTTTTVATEAAATTAEAAATTTTTTTTENHYDSELADNEPEALLELMDLSLYQVEEGMRSESVDNAVWQSTSYKMQGEKELDSLPALMAEETPIQLDKTTVQDLLDAGWSFKDSDEANEVVYHGQQALYRLYHKDGAVLDVYAWNNTKEDQTVVGCLVHQVAFSYDKYALGREYVSFTVGDMTKEAASYAAVKEVFGDFHRVSVNRHYQNDVYQNSNVTINYTFQIDGEECTVEFRFEDTAEGLKLGGFSLSY